MAESIAKPIISINFLELKVAIEGNDKISLEYRKNLLSNLLEKIGQGFGSDDSCLGILAVTGIPQLREKRNALLPLARELAILSKCDLDEVVVPRSLYQVGWSHGKEKLGADKYDLAKGSFYACPLTDDVLSATKKRIYEKGDKSTMNNNCPSIPNLEEIASRNPEIFACNVWPSKIPQLKTSFIEVATIVQSVGVMLAKLCDMYVESKCQGASFTHLEDVIENSLNVKGRLLHYFPSQNSENEDSDFSDWCGWHNDHGSLTGLVPGMYLDSSGQQVACPDHTAGLYVKSRFGDNIKVKLPSEHDCLAFQIGETTQILTGGILQATPHAVKGCGTKEATDVSRESFALFMQPENHVQMSIPEGTTIYDVQNLEKAKTLPKAVKTLQSRFKMGMNFGQFADATIKAFN